jgi:hypothetical protein
MVEITNKQQLALVEEIVEKMNPLNNRRISLEKNIYFLNEKYMMSHEEKYNEKINEKRKKLRTLNKELALLSNELNNIGVQHFIHHEGEIPLANGKQYIEIIIENKSIIVSEFFVRPSYFL